MNYEKIFLISLILLLIISVFTIGCKAEKVSEEPKIEKAEALDGKKETGLKITSPAFENNTMIPSKYSCDGDDINPPLSITGVPDNAKSLVLIVDDPDAPFKTWVHWTLFNINPETEEISENSVPQEAIEAMTDFGQPGYGGPCPPSGTHHYFFKLYALDATLNLDSSATAPDIEKAMKGHILDKAELIGLYEK